MKSRIFWLAVSFSLLLMIIGIIVMLEDEAQISQKSDEQYIPAVSVIKVQPKENTGIIKTYAQVRSRWNVTIKSRVNGEILQMSDKALVGQVIKKGDLLIRIKETPYMVGLLEAEQAVLSAQIELTRQIAKAKQAKADWNDAGINSTPTELALNIPQLELARLSLKVEQSRLLVARDKLANTKIVAPFSGIVTARNVSIAQNISEGEELLEILDNAFLEINVSLSKKQWQMLVQNWQNQTAIIKNMHGIEINRAKIKRGGGFLEQKTRQYKLYLEMENTSPSKVLSGDYVEVNLPGRTIENSLLIPQTALTREGLVWYLDDTERLRKFSAEVLFYIGENIVIKNPQSDMLGGNAPKTWLIATTPLASFLAGNLVQGVRAGGK